MKMRRKEKRSRCEQLRKSDLDYRYLRLASLPTYSSYGPAARKGLGHDHGDLLVAAPKTVKMRMVNFGEPDLISGPIPVNSA